MSDEKSAAAKAPSQQLVCLALLSTPVIYAGLIAFLDLSGSLVEGGWGDMDTRASQMLALMFSIVAVGSVAASGVLKKRILQSSVGNVDSNRRFQAVLVAIVLAESGAHFGLVLVLLTGHVMFGALLGGLSFAAMCFHFPSRAWLAYGDEPAPQESDGMGN